MNVTTLRDYAKQNNISYEAVRKQVVRYAAELEGHLIKDGRQQFLDEEAVAFLDAKRQKNPLAIIQQSKDEAIAELERENKNLRIQLENAQADLIAEQKENKKLLQAENEKFARLEAKNNDLSDVNKELEQKVADAEKTAENANMEAWHHYRVALEIYNALPWWKKRRRNAPEPPKEKE